MRVENPIEKAGNAVGGLAKLASLLGVSVQVVSNWKQRGKVPAEACPLIEKATNGAVRCEELRPDIAWDVLRGQTDSSFDPDSSLDPAGK